MSFHRYRINISIQIIAIAVSTGLLTEIILPGFALAQELSPNVPIIGTSYSCIIKDTGNYFGSGAKLKAKKTSSVIKKYNDKIKKTAKNITKIERSRKKDTPKKQAKLVRLRQELLSFQLILTELIKCINRTWPYNNDPLPPGPPEETPSNSSSSSSSFDSSSSLSSFSSSSISSTSSTANSSASSSSSSEMASGILSVTAGAAFVSSGAQGGPFNPSTKLYNFTNTGAMPINFAITKTKSWITLSGTSGTLAPNEDDFVIVSINLNANALAPGNYRDTISIINTTNGNGNTSRDISLTVTIPTGSSSSSSSNSLSSSSNSSPSSSSSSSSSSGNSSSSTSSASSSGSSGLQMRSSVSQFGITWTFDRAYPVGQFNNGDYYVVGTVKINSVSPGWDGQHNGSMVDPIPEDYQAYDAGANMFSAQKVVDFSVPIDPSTGTHSLVSTISRAGGCRIGGAYECLDTAAVLTVLANEPPAGSFRPPYVSGAKPIWNVAHVNYNLLPSLPVPPVPLPDFTNLMKRVWLAHGTNVWGSTIHPISNMPPYPRDSALQVSEMSLLVMLNIPEKQELTNRLIQAGIDLYSIALQNTMGFTGNGGFGNGWKFPTIFAGVMLGDAGMRSPPLYSSPGSTIEKYGEDAQTYYGNGWTGATALWRIDHYSSPSLAYEHKLPLTWTADGRGHPGDPPAGSNSDLRGESYRNCCSSHTWVGYALATRLLDAIPFWNHGAFFDYVDRWMAEEWVVTPRPQFNNRSFQQVIQQDTETDFVTSQGSSGSTFVDMMWFLYRYPAVCGDLQIRGAEQCDDGNQLNGDGCSSICQIENPTPDTGLAAYYNFNNNLTDWSGHYLTGTAQGSIGYVAGHNSQALNLDGEIGNCVELPSVAFNFVNDFSVSAWIKNSEPVYAQTILARALLLSSPAYEQFHLSLLTNGQFRFSVSDGESTLVAYGPRPAANQWTHVAATYQSKTVKLYVNGILVDNITNLNFAGIRSVNRGVAIGCRPGDYTVPWAGALDEIRVYNRVLSPADVAQLAAQ